ncbi:MAG TPA: hypothetical protein VFQ59_01815 [Candidatus Paceibacterota bacterium]|nr:hypothetical protein [Candidatus Paceibacterota bacterium]
MKFESIPEKRIIPPAQSPEVTQRKYDWMLLLLKGTFDDVDTNERPTALDLHTLRPDSKESDFLNWIEKEISVKKEVINGNGPESKEAFKIIDYAYQQGKLFLEETLKYSKEEVEIGPNEITSKKDIIDLLKKTTQVSGAVGLSRSLLYCRLVKATIAAYETIKHDAEISEEVTESFEDSLVSPITKYSANKSPLIKKKEDELGKHFYASENGSLKGFVETRGKEFQKTMLKFITRPESNAETAQKDSVGTRITIEKGKAMELIPILCKWLEKERKVPFLTIINQYFLSPEELKQLEHSLAQAFPKGNFLIKNRKSNITSMGGYVNIKIEGRLQSTASGDKFFSLAQHVRQFEIQIVDPANKNEKGKRSHYVLDVNKLVVARTRLDGGCPEKVFKQFIKEAHEASGISEKKLEDYLLKDDREGKAPIAKIRKQNGKKKEYYYASKAVYARWNEFNWVDPDLYAETQPKV